ncbi:endonuclease/exonuclease/phosphatase family protein [Candidatus Roizmanbacteria bacterium]|nr:endonuclease/exonuclease/phosphatase family protein [Candidatus Roizmanbacteria bacterium]
MKLVSLNVAVFEKNNPQLSGFFLKNKFDFVCLQEVTKRVDNEVSEDYLSKNPIDDSTKELKYSFFGPLWIKKGFSMKNFHGKEKFEFSYGGNIEFGNYVKSKYKIYKGQNIFVQNHFTYVTDWSYWPEEDHRAVQVVDILISANKKLRLLNYHGIWTQHKQGNDLAYKACKKIEKLALEVDYPSIICGDFNLFPETPSIKLFDENFINLPNKYNIMTTRPPTNELHGKERNVVDYIFISKGVKVNSFEVLDSDVSDHLPLLLDFDLV